MNEKRASTSDDRLAQLLASVEASAAPPDRAVLAALREKSAAVFAEAGREPVLTHQQKSNMFFGRALIAIASAAAVVIGAYLLRDSQRTARAPTGELTLGQVMNNLLRAQTYRAEWKVEDATYEVVGRADRGMRIESASPDRYAIAAGERFWEIDEAENRAVPALSRYYSPELKTVDPFQLMAMPVTLVSHELPRGKRIDQGREVYVFRSTLPGQHHDSTFETTVDVATTLPVVIRELDASGKPLPAELQFVAFGLPVDEGKLQVPATLTEDGRIGKITDWQGLVTLRPKTQTRWTPVCDRPLLRPGDWLRTDARGANAVTVQLAPQTQLILGPGSLVELVKPDQIVLHTGTAEITPSPKADNFSGKVQLKGPSGSALDVAGVLLVAASDKGLVTSDRQPAWLAGYKGQLVQESLGSLVTKIDGRDVPLTVGYHKVSVEIRDQIARTTIEESFVNHTDQQLEGQFHFPLPADASISGFGMWIGDKLVEADIVEKQRAREIYETILREKRDPGLLEWTGGNIFKARVFPIFANSEKRIKITYTQVLPRKGDSYRYSYALQSEMLRQTPLRELDLDVTVHSTPLLAALHSPTHLARNQLTEHSGRLEFSAQQYAPTRDFEAVIQVAGDSPDLTFIPHQRGEDGYFMLLLQPPAEAGAWKRDLLADSKVNLIILADTSASMDVRSRKAQAETLAALLGSLTPRDSFQLAACDVDCVWSADGPQAADEKSTAAARDFLAKRRSLGWTDLDKAFSAAIERADSGTQIVYLGDGIVTSGEADGAAFAQRLARMAGGKEVTLHAVAVSSSYDAPVLRSIASIGGGSLRMIGGEVGPQLTAKNLLAEITRPALRNIQLEFKGLRTARVYPRTLPNVPAGTQQIILGRYKPEEIEQAGEVIVTGTLDGKLATYRTGFRVQGSGPSEVRANVVSNPQSAIRNPQSDPDSSFIPRLWARLHLDELLAQGSSQEIQDEIIALSEEFHIMTPYTSLLVLESDADRERFKVKKRFQMRDGERFFAEGRDEAQYNLVQQQMRRAGLWRIGLRRQVLAALSTLGRFPEQVETRRLFPALYKDRLPESGAAAWSGRGSGQYDSMLGSAGGVGGITFGSDRILYLGDGFDGSEPDMPGMPLPPAVPAPLYAPEGRPPLEDLSEKLEKAAAAESLTPVGWDVEAAGAEIDAGLNLALGQQQDFEEDFKRKISINLFSDEAPPVSDYRSLPTAGRAFRGERSYAKEGWLFAASPTKKESESLAYFNRFLSPLLPVDVPPAAAPQHKPRPRKSLWPADAQELSRSLRATIDLSKVEGGLVIDEQVDSLDAHRQRLTSRSRTLALESAKAWLTLSQGDDSDGRLEWTADGKRGAGSQAYELAVVRKSAAADLLGEYDPGDWWRRDLADSYRDYAAEVQRPAEGQALLVLRHVIRSHEEIRLLIDTVKATTLSIEHRSYGRMTGSTKASDLVEVAGVWLPRKIEHFDEQGRRTSATTREYKVLTTDQFAERLKQELKPVTAMATISAPLPPQDAAQAAVAGGKATLEDRLVLLADFAARQKWTEASAQFAECEKLLAGKPFAAWLKVWFLQASRRNEELRQHLLKAAEQLAGEAHAGDLVLANRLIQTARDALAPSEQLAILDQLKPVFARQPEHARILRTWGRWRADVLSSAGREDDYRAALREQADAWPDDVQAQVEYANRLAGEGDFAAAYARLQQAIDDPRGNWPPDERDQLYQTYANRLKEQGRYGDLVTWLQQWLKLEPTDSDAYEMLLAALIYTDRQAEADELITRWIRDSFADPPLAEAARARRDAAALTATGDNSYLRGGDTEPRWFELLAEVLLHYVGTDDASNVVWSIYSDYESRQSDSYRAAARQLHMRLKEQADDLPPDRLANLINWLVSYSAYEGEIPEDDWKAVAATIRKRWEAAEHPAIRDSLAQSLLQVLGELSEVERLAFRRVQLEKAPDEERPAFARALFDALLEADWSDATEAGSLALIDQLSAADDAAERLSEQVAALYRWTDRMEQARFEQAVSKIEHPEMLKRTELIERRRALLKEARAAVADRLKAAADMRADGLKPWLHVERLTIEIRLDRDPAKVVEACWELLGPVPAAAKPAVDDVPSDEDVAERLSMVLRSRLVTMLLRLATRKGAEPAETARIEKYLDDSLARDPEGELTAIDVRQIRYALLIALDRPQELAEKLTTWSKTAKYPQGWKRALAYLQAELGKLDEAVALLQTLSADDALAAADYRALAGWQQALGRREQHDAALLATYEQLNEYQLRDIVRRHLAPWERSEGPTPGPIDPELFVALKALFAKANDPQDHVYHVRQFYEASRDFRLLAALADAVIGQSAQNVYRFLRELTSTLDEIDREAAADELLAHLAQVRERAKTPIDRRALDLLEFLVARRTAEVSNQPGPHVQRAIAALGRSEKHEWSPGELLPMGELLANQRRISQPTVAAELLRVLDRLYAATPEESLERLQAAEAYARGLEAHDRAADARSILEASLAGYRRTAGGKLTYPAQDPLLMLSRLYLEAGQFLRAESILAAELPRAANPEIARRLTAEIFSIDIRALQEGGATSLGSGPALYGSTRDELLAAIAAAEDARQRQRLVDLLCELFRQAHIRELPSAPADLLRFANADLPALLKLQVDEHQNIVERVANTIREVSGPREALAFLVTRIENEPRWLALAGERGWQKFSWRLGEWREEAKDLGEVEPRLLAIVLAELRRDLTRRSSNTRVMYSRGYSRFWTEKSGDFARVAEEVLAQHRDSERSVLYIAEYLFDGLELKDRAIAALLDVHSRKLLGDGGQSQLAHYLERAERWGEAALILEPLVQRWPDALGYRTRLMHAYFLTKRQEGLLALLAETDKHFHADDRWNEDTAGQLAASCLENELYEQAVAYYQEAIGRREEALPGRGIGDERLATYYVEQARTFAGLKNTAAAVDAAASAIVVWGAAGDGPPSRRRDNASVKPLEVLVEVLEASPNLDEFVAHLDKEVATAGEDRPVIRKAIGEVYSARKEHAKALAQLKLAVELSPNDPDLHKKLIATYDALMQPAEAAKQLLAAAELSPRDVNLWADLAERLEKLEQPAEAERARTSLVEVLSTETEGHTKLAEIRQTQQRFDDAMLHWRHVARIRKLEPDGLVGLAGAQILAKNRAAAESTLTELEKTDWPSRFHDELREKLPKLREESKKLK
jgi:predicted Zn-dependent protease